MLKLNVLIRVKDIKDEKRVSKLLSSIKSFYHNDFEFIILNNGIDKAMYSYQIVLASKSIETIAQVYKNLLFCNYVENVEMIK